MARQLRRTKTDWGSWFQITVQEALWLSECYYNLDFSFLNLISLLFISSSYPNCRMRLGGIRSRTYTAKKVSRIWRGIEPWAAHQMKSLWRRRSERAAFRHFTYVTTHSPTLPSLYLRHKFILQSFRCFTYVTVHSPTFFRLSYITGSSPGVPPMNRTRDGSQNKYKNEYERYSS